MANCIEIFQCLRLCCFATYWISFGIIFTTIGIVAIGFDGPYFGAAIVFTSASLIPFTVGCSLCYCLNKGKCYNAFATSVDPKIDTTGTIVVHQPNTTIQLPSETHTRVIFMGCVYERGDSQLLNNKSIYLSF